MESKRNQSGIRAESKRNHSGIKGEEFHTPANVESKWNQAGSKKRNRRGIKVESKRNYSGIKAESKRNQKKHAESSVKNSDFFLLDKNGK